MAAMNTLYDMESFKLVVKFPTSQSTCHSLEYKLFVRRSRTRRQTWTMHTFPTKNLWNSQGYCLKCLKTSRSKLVQFCHNNATKKLSLRYFCLLFEPIITVPVTVTVPSYTCCCGFRMFHPTQSKWTVLTSLSLMAKSWYQIMHYFWSAYVLD